LNLTVARLLLPGGGQRPAFGPGED